MSENKGRRIKVLCRAVGKMVTMVAWEEERVDLGSIARTFGVDPPTLKLNGHFISRGVDLIASSVTWNSLLSFFSARGLPTGENDSKPLVVDGKLCKLGTKRVGDVTESHDDEDVVDNRGWPALELEGANLVIKKNKKMRTGYGKIGRLCSKRKELMEDVNLLKKLKISETNPDIQGRSKSQCSSSSNISSTQLNFRCSSYMSGSMKRLREDEAVVVAAPCKKIT